MAETRAASTILCAQSIDEVEARQSDLTLISARDAGMCGSQVCFVFEHGCAGIQTLMVRDVARPMRCGSASRSFSFMRAT
ncbi:hypothetical protein V8J82_11550 [Gymnodinialimonas sp. 2305UL16-5]|uniref:kynureninase/PvdN C-terminal domain-containing protein n=1 Tax=Gymnodinialimonas mytili TaxID=3126503 RepID=UPI0030A4CF09